MTEKELQSVKNYISKCDSLEFNIESSSSYFFDQLRIDLVPENPGVYFKNTLVFEISIDEFNILITHYQVEKRKELLAY